MTKKLKKSAKPAQKKAPVKKVAAKKPVKKVVAKKAAPKAKTKPAAPKVEAPKLSFLATVDKDLKAAKPTRQPSFMERVKGGKGDSFISNLSSRH